MILYKYGSICVQYRSYPIVFVAFRERWVTQPVIVTRSLHVWKSAGVCSSGNNGNKRQIFPNTYVMLKCSTILAQSLQLLLHLPGSLIWSNIFIYYYLSKPLSGLKYSLFSVYWLFISPLQSGRSLHLIIRLLSISLVNKKDNAGIT